MNHVILVRAFVRILAFHILILTFGVINGCQFVELFDKRLNIFTKYYLLP